MAFSAEIQDLKPEYFLEPIWEISFACEDEKATLSKNSYQYYYDKGRVDACKQILRRAYELSNSR